MQSMSKQLTRCKHNKNKAVQSLLRGKCVIFRSALLENSYKGKCHKFIYNPCLVKTLRAHTERPRLRRNSRKAADFAVPRFIKCSCTHTHPLHTETDPLACKCVCSNSLYWEQLSACVCVCALRLEPSHCWAHTGEFDCVFAIKKTFWQHLHTFIKVIKKFILVCLHELREIGLLFWLLFL